MFNAIFGTRAFTFVAPRLGNISMFRLGVRTVKITAQFFYSKLAFVTIISF